MASLALAAGYRTALEVCDQASLSAALEEMRAADGPSFLRVLVSTGSEIAPRVTRSPDEIARAFKKSLTA